ncbi:leucine-rich repeat protein [Lachnoanaerobaculum gingivalis]
MVKINSCAFLGCKNLIEVKLPENVTEISFACFSGCKHLRTVVL